MGENTQTIRSIRVLLADDHTMFRQGLAGVLASYGGMEVIAEVPNDADALEIAGDLQPYVVVMQMQLPFSRAVETLRAMRSFPDPAELVE
jgi:DNA-binding NarL/FixJ family response regulator